MTREQALDAWAAMTAEERLAMAETAPMIAEAWVDTERSSSRWSGRLCSTVALTGGVWMDTDCTWSKTRDEAKAKADARLKQEGWILK